MPQSVVLLSAWVDPAAAFEAVCADAEHAFWLDAGPDADTGWSWLGTGIPERDPHRVGAQRRGVRESRVPGPFAGGWVGWRDYESGAASAGAPAAALAAEDAPGRWLRTDAFLAFDHATRQVWAIAADTAAAEALARTAATPSHHRSSPQPPVRTATARHRPDEYAELVEACRDRIRDGDAYQLCLTTRFTVTGHIDPRAVFAALRRSLPSAHGALILSGGIAVASATPERFVELRGDVVRTRPIKGTRPRSADPERDDALAAELSADPKERAENVMIVDLMRNDLARVCASGTVTVERLLDVERHPAVHQLVSTVAGRLRPEASVGDVLAATFPAGSMTGAPKLSAMTILLGLEGAPRGAYAGCVGWVGEDGDADLAMLIRTVVIHPTGASVGAGGGITWLSRPAAEVAEVALKARAPLAALGAQLPPGW